MVSRYGGGGNTNYKMGNSLIIAPPPPFVMTYFEGLKTNKNGVLTIDLRCPNPKRLGSQHRRMATKAKVFELEL